MKAIETNHIADITHGLNEAVQRQLGGAMYAPSLTAERTTAAYAGMVPYTANPTILVVPTKQNMQALASQVGTPFGLLVGRQIRPAVVTPRSTADRLDITYLAPPAHLQGTSADVDHINPRNPAISPEWALFLKQAAGVQDRRVGADHVAGRPMGREVGHSVLATVALKQPDILRGGHIVHQWTNSESGIAGAVTGRSVGLYDFKLRDGERQISEHTTTIAAADTAYLLRIPELDRAVDELAPLSAADLAVGLGLVAIQSQTGASPQLLQRNLVTTMERL